MKEEFLEKVVAYLGGAEYQYKLARKITRMDKVKRKEELNLVMQENPLSRISRKLNLVFEKKLLRLGMDSLLIAN